MLASKVEAVAVSVVAPPLRRPGRLARPCSTWCLSGPEVEPPARHAGLRRGVGGVRVRVRVRVILID